ncbi:hypothetical protein GCM10017687_35080 [Streptomyces echinatus]
MRPAALVTDSRDRRTLRRIDDFTGQHGTSVLGEDLVPRLYSNSVHALPSLSVISRFVVDARVLGPRPAKGIRDVTR